MNNSSLDAGIPLLTEIISPPQPANASEIKSTQPIPSPVIEEDMAVTDVQENPAWNDEKWERLEREIRERILRQVLERIDLVLEERVRDSLADVLQIAVEGLAAEIRGGLHHTVKDVITRAVSQEITRLQATEK